jgi:hypothetical protein
MEEGESTSSSLLPARRVFRAAETFACLSSLLSDHDSLSDQPVPDLNHNAIHKSGSTLSPAVSSIDKDDDGSKQGDSWGLFIS